MKLNHIRCRSCGSKVLKYLGKTEKGCFFKCNYCGTETNAVATIRGITDEINSLVEEVE